MGRRVHLKVRLEQERRCLLVMVGVRSDGRKELVAQAKPVPRHRMHSGNRVPTSVRQYLSNLVRHTLDGVRLRS